MPAASSALRFRIGRGTIAAMVERAYLAGTVANAVERRAANAGAAGTAAGRQPELEAAAAGGTADGAADAKNDAAAAGDTAARGTGYQAPRVSQVVSQVDFVIDDPTTLQVPETTNENDQSQGVTDLSHLEAGPVTPSCDQEINSCDQEMAVAVAPAGPQAAAAGEDGRPRRRGRPPSGVERRPVVVYLSDAEIAVVDAAADRAHIRSRSEALRRLLVDVAALVGRAA